MHAGDLHRAVFRPLVRSPPPGCNDAANSLRCAANELRQRGAQNVTARKRVLCLHNKTAHDRAASQKTKERRGHRGDRAEGSPHRTNAVASKWGRIRSAVAAGEVASIKSFALCVSPPQNASLRKQWWNSDRGLWICARARLARG